MTGGELLGRLLRQSCPDHPSEYRDRAGRQYVDHTDGHIMLAPTTAEWLRMYVEDQRTDGHDPGDEDRR